MKHQADLFSNSAPAPEAPDAADATSTSRKVVALHFDDAVLSPAQKTFNRLLSRVESLTLRLEATRNLADGHRPTHVVTLQPLEREYADVMRQMALFLADRLKRKGLTRQQRRAATDIACELSAGLALQGDPEMQALHDKLSPQSLEEKGKEAADGMRSLLEDILGEKLNKDEAEDPDEVLRAAMRRLNQRAEAEQAHAHGHKAARKKSASQRKAEQTTLDAQTALRTVYRQLASALHPDRETDPDERARKTALMSQANAAYERRDLVTLLQLRLRAENLDDAKTLAHMAREKIEALNLLLKEQVSALDRDLWTLEQGVRGEFDLSPGAPVTAASLQRSLREQQQALKLDIRAMRSDFQRVQDDTQLKRWLKEQIEMAEELDPFDDSNFF